MPRAQFRSYYGRPVLKTPAWEWKIAAYLFSGGLSAGSALLAAGADLNGQPALRRVSRVGALASIATGSYFLIADLGRPERFHHMLRVAKPSSPMSVGTWILAAYGPAPGWPGRRIDAGATTAHLARRAAGPVGPARGPVGGRGGSRCRVLYRRAAVPDGSPGLARSPSVPALRLHRLGRGQRRGLGMLLAPVAEAAPARRMSVAGAALEVAASRLLERRLGLVGEAYTTGPAHRTRKWAEYLTVGGRWARSPRAATALAPRCAAWPCSPAVRCSGSGV
ncbi:polysulfide reductase, NrfD family protein [Mycobacterium ulcerans str. Harvey]|uniref:Polysulfide reductase, NrfD family protein n=1 Tax=Mycobacterium ulcerans str. Harvey TaxID=1299332 RepID=A0ABP3A5L8_MYCUL|nr:polysulfide reductase, NrfD family protein [Mycobacterium ulcerans str. Harvey]